MKQLNYVRGVRPLIGALIAVCLLAGPSFAAVYNLRAATTAVTMPDGAVITMWGFECVSAVAPAVCPGTGGVTVPGPMLEVLPGDTTLTINLQNDLPVPISLVIPGQPASLSPVSFVDSLGRTRVRSFTSETAATTLGVYTWNNLKPGTYIYHSGTHPAKQVQMGLYGGLKIDAVAGTDLTPPETYPGVPYDNEVILFYSEIDPAMHLAVTGQPGQPPTYGTAAYPSAYDYKPKYFLINGKPYPDAAPIMDHPLQTNERVLVRFLNMGLRDLVPTITNLYWNIVAEDGNLYPYPQTQYTMLLSAGKTKDAILAPAEAVTYPVFDRRLSLTNNTARDGGMLVKLDVAPASTPSVTITSPLDGATFTQGAAITFTGSAVDAEDGSLTGSLAWISSLNGTIGAGGTFSTSTLSLGTHTITASVTNSDGNLGSASISITVAAPNTAPTVTIAQPANNSSFNEGTSVTFAGNASDTQDGNLTANLTWSSSLSGTIGSGGSFAVSTLTPGTHTVTAAVTDSGGLSNSASVTVTILNVNDPPVAVDDSASTPRNTAKFINMVANDSDPDGTVNPNSIVIVTQPTRGGTVQVVTNGVNYTPKKNFRGTDTFTYTVKDNNGATSNVATVRVNVL